MVCCRRFKPHWKSRTGRVVTFERVLHGLGGPEPGRSPRGSTPTWPSCRTKATWRSSSKRAESKPSWKDGPNKGIVTHSLVVIGHRPGNPKAIKDWPDLAKPGVGVLYPDPKTSGGARWNINAIYGSALLASRDQNAGQADLTAVRDLLAKIQANVVNMDESGRQSMANFAERSTGDAVVTYENELLLRNKDKEAIPYVIPAATLLIESPAAVVETSVAAHGSRAVAEAFLEFLLSDDGQRIVAEFGFRPVKPGAPGPSGAPPCRPSSSRWPTWAVGPRSSKSSMVPRASGPRSSRSIPTERASGR